MTWRRIGICFDLLMAVVAVIAGLWTLTDSFDLSGQARGVVIDVRDGACTVRFRDAGGHERTYHDLGGKYGCEWKVGRKTAVYYDPENPSDADNLSPVVNGLMGAGLVLGAAIPAVHARAQIKAGKWNQRPSSRRMGPARVRSSRHRR